MTGTGAPAATILVRLLVGAVFVSEGIQKLLYPADVGTGRFAAIGFPHADLVAPAVAGVEIVCGTLVLLGLATRAAALPLVAIMLVALATTKLPILLGQDLGPFRVRRLERYGGWAMAHEARTDWAMLLGALFLALVGPGPWSLDARRGGRRRRG